MEVPPVEPGELVVSCTVIGLGGRSPWPREQGIPTTHVGQVVKIPPFY